MQRAFHSIFFTTLPLAILSCLIPLCAEAQVTPDGTTSTAVNQDGNNFTIEQGDRIDDNLFHSFNEFSVPTLGSAVFNNAGDIANIFSRVTGSSISNIDGILGANGTTNLYLINPNGIIFGENASLNLGGSFFASTADSLLFEGDAEFSAVDPQATPLLEVSIPIGARFRDNPGDIINRSIIENGSEEKVGLEITTGNNLVFLGGDLSFEAGNATARGGNIYLGGLAEAGTVILNQNGSLSFPGDLVLADITLSKAADINTLGTGGGNITIDAQNLSLAADEFSSLIRAGIAADSTSTEAQAGDIAINVAENIILNRSSITNQINSGGIGNAGDLIINTNFLELTNGGRISANTFGKGNAGTVNITAIGDITANGETSTGSASNINSVVSRTAEGDSGGITVSTTNLNLTNGGRIGTGTLGTGNAGAVNITAIGDITADGENSTGFASSINSGVNTGAVGEAGGVRIEATNLNLTNGGQVSANTLGTGNAGGITIKATESITIDGFTERFRIRSGISANALIQDGNGGDVFINTGSLTIASSGTIEATNFDFAGLFDSGTGQPGNITIVADSIALTDNVRIEAATQSTEGESAIINLQIAEDLTLQNNTSISARAFNDANGGNLTINADDGFILASSNGNNDIIANASEGRGGEIDITTQAIFGLEERPLNPFTNDINASSEANGLDGTIDINNPAVDPTTGLINLPASVGDATDQISQNPCQQGVGSQFIVTGKGGLPPNPTETLNSESARVDLIEPVPSTNGREVKQNNSNNSTESVPAQGWVFNDRGEVTLTAYATSANQIQRSGQKNSSTCKI